MATLTAEQFQALLATITAAGGSAQPPPPGQQAPQNNPAALGPMPACVFGPNKMTRL